MRTRIFQGSHWLYQVETADGLVTVIRQNTGETVPAEGDAVHLVVAGRGMRVTPYLLSSPALLLFGAVVTCRWS